MKHVGQAFRFGKALLLEKAGIKTPIVATYIVSFKCNLRCKYCGVWGRQIPEMNLDEIKKMMDEFAEMGTVKFGLTGGEPLLRQDIQDIIEYSKSKGFVTTMVTNGTMVKNNLDKLKKLDLLIFSIDGDKKTHDKIRGEGVYDKATESAIAAKEAGIEVCIQSVLSSANLEEDCRGLRSIIDFVKKNNLKFVCQPLYFDNYNLSNDDMQELKKIEENYKKALDILREFKKECPKQLMLSSSEIDWFEKWKDSKSKMTCHAGKLFFMIEPDGKLVRCILKDSDKVDGRKLGFKNAIKQLTGAPKGCKCCLACYTKYNMMFNMDIRTLLEAYNTVA